MEDMQIWAKEELPAFVGADPIGWIARAETFFEVQEILSFHKLQYAFISMEGVAIHEFYYWSQKNPDSSWESFSTALTRRFKDSYSSRIFEGLTALKQEQTETKTLIEEVVTPMKKQEPKPIQDGSWKKVAFRKEAPFLWASISELKSEQLKSPEIALEVKREERVEAQPSEIKIKKRVEGIKEINQMLQLLIKKKGSFLLEKENKQPTQVESSLLEVSANNPKKALEVFANERFKPTIEEEPGVNEQDSKIVVEAKKMAEEIMAEDKIAHCFQNPNSAKLTMKELQKELVTTRQKFLQSTLSLGQRKRRDRKRL
ncbi:hypothetical protein CR513_07708, partial [Mucuna pruriens]